MEKKKKAEKTEETTAPRNCKLCGEAFVPPPGVSGETCGTCTAIRAKAEAGSDAWKLIVNTIQRLGLTVEKKKAKK